MEDLAEVAEDWRIPDKLWEQIEPELPPDKPRPKGGRRRAPARQMLNAIFYVLRTGIQWQALPRSLGAGSTVHDRFQEWVAAGVFWQPWRAGLREYDDRLGLDWDWEALDGAMTKAPLGGEKNRAQSHRPRQDRHETLLADRRARLTHWPGRRRRQSPRFVSRAKTRLTSAPRRATARGAGRSSGPIPGSTASGASLSVGRRRSPIPWLCCTLPALGSAFMLPAFSDRLLLEASEHPTTTC